jgi:methyltransferase (TIGR00027 family)
VATYRAQETERPDGLFHDPLAARLAGDRGRKIADAMPYPKIMYWILVVRTVAIDRLITHAIERGADTVLNLGAGLDTRPYRMKLPASLRWIEVDFPDMIAYKNEILSAETPACRLERIAADLSDIPARRKLFAQIGEASKEVAVITEGLIPYLSADDAANLSADLYAVPSFRSWIQDYRQGGIRRLASRRMRNVMKDSPFKFEVDDSIGFFQKQGWAVGENILAAEESIRIGRPFPFIFPWGLLMIAVPPRVKEKWRKSAGYLMYRK